MAGPFTWLSARLARARATARGLGLALRASLARILQNGARGQRSAGFKHDAAGAERFEAIAEAMVASDIAGLKSLADGIPGFAGAVDPYSAQPWFHIAVEIGSVETIEWMIEQGSDVNGYGPSGACPLSATLLRESDDLAEVVEILVRAGADVNSCGPMRMAPIHEAAVFGSTEFAIELLRHGANPTVLDAEPQPRRASQIAREGGHIELAEMLLKAEAEFKG